MPRKQSEVLAEELEVLRAEIKVITENDEATEDEIARGEALGEEWDTKKAAYDKALAREAKVDEIMRASLVVGNRESNGPTVVTRNKRNPYEDLHRSKMWTSTDFISRAEDAIEQAPDHMSDEARENATNLIRRGGARQRPLIAQHILRTGSPEYHEEFENYVSNPENVQRAALSLTSANGGYLVPFTLDPTIVLTNSGSANPFRQISAIKTTATNSWNGVSSAGVNAAWLAEATEASDNSPTFGNIAIPVHKAAAWVFGSFEVLQDSDFASEFTRLIADAKDRLEEAAFATGDGDGKPTGIMTAATTTVDTATAATYAVGDVYALQAAVPPRWRSKSSWVMNVAQMNRTRQFDQYGGSSFWANLGAGQPERLLGSPIYESSTLASTITSGSKIAVYGDFSQYAIVDRIGMSVLYDPLIKGENQRPTGQGGWFAFWRVGAKALTANAFRVLVSKAS